MHNFIIGPCDTDGMSFCKADMSPFSDEEIVSLLNELNDLMEEHINFEHEKTSETLIAVSAKNYVLKDAKTKKIKIKGASLKATYKEIALKEFMRRFIDIMLVPTFSASDPTELLGLYNEYVIEIMGLTEMTRYSSKKTITDSVLNPKRSNEQNILDAVKGESVQMGDKIRVFYLPDGTLKLEKNFTGEYCKVRLLEKLHKTVLIFDTIIDPKLFTNYSLKRSQQKLIELLQNKTVDVLGKV